MERRDVTNLFFLFAFLTWTEDVISCEICMESGGLLLNNIYRM